MKFVITIAPFYDWEVVNCSIVPVVHDVDRPAEGIAPDDIWECCSYQKRSYTAFDRLDGRLDHAVVLRVVAAGGLDD